MKRPTRFKPKLCHLLSVLAVGSAVLFSQIASAVAVGAHHLAGAIITRQELAPPLTFGEVVKGEIKGGEVHTFSIQLTFNQYARLTVRRHGIDLVVRISSPQSRVDLKLENPAGAYSPMFASIRAEDPGTYRIQIRPSAKWLPKARYEIELQEVPVPTLRDEKRLQAQQKLAEGRNQQLLETSKSLGAALLSYDQALELWREAGDPFEEANTLQLIAQTHRALTDLEKADVYYQKALLSRKDDPQALAYTLLDRADAYYYLKSPRASLPLYEEALQLFRETRNRRGEAVTLTQIGIIAMRLFDWERAREILEEALEVNRSDGDVYEEMRVVNALGGVYDNQGNPGKAMEFYTRARDFFTLIGDSARAGNIYINIGLLHDTFGEWKTATDNYNQALELMDAGLARGEVTQAYVNGKKASLFYNLGSLYVSFGAYPEGLAYLQKSLELRTANERGGTLTWFAYAFILQNKPREALNYCEQALLLQEPAGDPRRAQTYTIMGMAHHDLGNFGKAIDYFNRALEIQQSSKSADQKGLAITLDKRGATFAAMGEITKARKDLDAAVSLWRTFQDRNGEALSLFQLARVEREAGEINTALLHAEAAMKFVEPLRQNVVGQQMRASYFATKVHYYELYIDLLMRSRERSDVAEHTAAAFEASERERARGLLDTLTEANLDHTAFSDPTLSAIVEKQKFLQRNVFAKLAMRSRLLRQNPNPPDLAGFDRELASLNAEQESLHKQLEVRYPHYAALTSAEPAKVSEIQKQLDTGTLVLEYALGNERSYVWAVSPNSIDAFELPARDLIESVARRVTNALTARNREEKNETWSQRQARIVKAEKDYSEASAALSKMVIEPVAPLLGEKRLVVVADGALQMIPFAALPLPESSRAAQQTMPRADLSNARAVAAATRLLISEHEVISLPSASVLVLQRRELANRKIAPHAVAILADPVFDLQDARVAKAIDDGKQSRKKIVATGLAGEGKKENKFEQSTSLQATGLNAALTSALRDIGLTEDGKLPRLTHSLQEATAIARAVPADQSFTALGFKASRETANSPQLSKYRIIHFATHGVLDLEHPELSGIVLSMVDEKGKSQDGYLRLHEIYNLNLPAELVVLSACQTGVGKQIKGEGVIALTRGFMYAGAKSVVASLWKVDDAATAELMAEFYKQMFTNKLKPAAALRAAQINLSQQTRWRSPYYWAGFFIQGEWN